MDKVLPCNGCTVCCQWGDDPEGLRPDPSLHWKDNGDCEHLGPTGCTIWETRPQACRDYDCRELLEACRELTYTRTIIAAVNLENRIRNKKC